MYVEGTNDLMGFILVFPFLSAEDKEKQRAFIVQKATSRYFPVYEKVWSRIIFFPDSGGITMETGYITTTRRSVSAVLYTRTSIMSVGWRGVRRVSDMLRWAGSTQETLNVFSSPCPGEEGSDRADLMGFWCPARVSPPE